MLTQSVCSYDALSGQLAGIDPVSTLRILENAQVSVGLGHSPERRFQPSAPPVLDIVSAESNRHFLICRTSSAFDRSPPTVSFFLSPYLGLLSSARLFRIARRRSVFVPRLPRPPCPFPSPFPFPPPSPLRAVAGKSCSLVPYYQHLVVV